jgi:hypothetical protein
MFPAPITAILLATISALSPTPPSLERLRETGGATFGRRQRLQTTNHIPSSVRQNRRRSLHSILSLQTSSSPSSSGLPHSSHVGGELSGSAI